MSEYKCLIVFLIFFFLKCVTTSVRDHQKCSQCVVQVTEDNVKYGEYVQTLKFLFPTVASGNEINTVDQSLSPTTDDPTSYLVITTLSGESTTIPYNADQTILHLKEVVKQKLKAPSNKQSLLYNGIELKVLCIFFFKSTFNVLRLTETVDFMRLNCLVLFLLILSMITPATESERSVFDFFMVYILVWLVVHFRSFLCKQF